MKCAGGKRCVVLAYRSENEQPTNPLSFQSQSLQHIMMFVCGPRGGVQSCPLGARTVCPDSHVMTAIALAGYLAYGHTLGSCHRRVNMIDPGYHPLPIDQQADVLEDVIM